MSTGNTPTQTQTSTPAPVRLPLIVLGSALLMAAYELLKQSLFPAMSLWQSHTITIVFVALTVTAAAWLVRSRYRLLHKRILEQIAERERAEAALQHEQQFTRTLLDSMGNGVVACDADGKL